MIMRYDWPSDFARAKDIQVFINDQAIDVLLECGGVPFCAFSCDGEVSIRVEFGFDVEEASVSPRRLGIAVDHSDNVYSFSLSGPEKLLLHFGLGKWLYLYANPMPDDQKTTHRFAGGRRHDVGILDLKCGESVYLEPGAVLHGAIRAEDANDLEISGFGILDHAVLERGVRPIGLRRCRDVRIRDLTLVNNRCWGVVPVNCDKLLIDGINLITTELGRDGIDIVSSRDVHIRRCMIQSGDDCIVLKTGSPARLGRDCQAIHSVLVDECSLMNVNCGNALEIGHETCGPPVEDVTFRNCDVLGTHGGATFSIHAYNSSPIRRVTYDNIRVEHFFAALIDFRTGRSRYTSTEEIGVIDEVLLKDIDVTASIYTPGYTLSVIGGQDAAHPVSNVTFENLRINGRKITNADELDLFFKHVQNVAFR